MASGSTPDVPSIMERMVKLSSERDGGEELDISELARRFENLEYQVRLPALQKGKHIKYY